jgi:hypothetical protein
MSKDSLLAWKTRIAEYQRGVREGRGAIEQPALFDLPKTTWHTADEIDPLGLKRYPWDFYDQPVRQVEPPDDSNRGCLYFQIDHEADIVLYIGETKLGARDRWLGTHYCKEYIKSYLQLHHDLGTQAYVCAAFWYHVPPKKKILLEWERELIYKWRSPFNKEMWEIYGQPFKRI